LQSYCIRRQYGFITQVINADELMVADDSNSNSQDNVYGAVIMAGGVVQRVDPVHLMNTA